jgi:hypothetical protein
MISFLLFQMEDNFLDFLGSEYSDLLDSNQSMPSITSNTLLQDLNDYNEYISDGNANINLDELAKVLIAMGLNNKTDNNDTSWPQWDEINKTIEANRILKQNTLEFITVGILLTTISVFGLVGNIVAIIVLSRPVMKGSFSSLLIGKVN